MALFGKGELYRAKAAARNANPWGAPAASGEMHIQILLREPRPNHSQRDNAGHERGKAQRYMVEGNMDEGMHVAGYDENPHQGNLDGVEPACRKHEQTYDIEEDRKLQKIHVCACRTLDPFGRLVGGVGLEVTRRSCSPDD